MKKWILCTAAALALFGAAATAEAKPPANPPHDPPGAGAPRHPRPHKAPPHKDPPPPRHPAPPPHWNPLLLPSDDSPIHVIITL